MKATIPDGEHPFDYLFEGHQFLMAGCLLLEEIDSPLEEEELEADQETPGSIRLNASESSTRESIVLRRKRNDRFREA